MEESMEEKYLGDMIHTDGLSASILSTVNKRIKAIYSKLNTIMNLAENPKMYGLQNSQCARTLYESEIVTSLLNNSASWIGLNDEIISILQNFQHKFMLRFFEAPVNGTPAGIVDLDSNMLLMKNRIIQNKLICVGKLMTNALDQNMGKRALLNGKETCKGKDLLTECETWCTENDIPDVTKGCLDTNMIKKAVGAKNEKDILEMMEHKPKIGDRYSEDRKERDYIQRMSLRDTRIWFRQRSRMTVRIKANRSSQFKNKMGCRYCDEDVRVETQEHLEVCEGFTYEQRNLNMNEERGKLIFWRRMAPKLKSLNDHDKWLELKERLKKKKAEQAEKKLVNNPVIATKAKPKPKKLGALQKTIKATVASFAERRKKITLGTNLVQGDHVLTTSGQVGATPHLHREGLSCAVEVPSTRGSREGEPPLRRLPP